MKEVSDYLELHLPHPRKSTPSGWMSFNCPMCVLQGEPRPDTRKRGGVKIEIDGSIIYNCLNCGYATTWKPGDLLTKKLETLLGVLGVSSYELKKLQFYLYQNQSKPKEVVKKKTFYLPDFVQRELPFNSKPILEWANDPNPPQDFIDVVSYLSSRGQFYLKNSGFYWSPDKEAQMNRRILIPFFFRNKIVGYTARYIDKIINKEISKYYNNMPENFLFNSKAMEIDNREYVIVVEGPFDAMCIDGVAVLGKALSQTKLDWLKSSGKKIIILPDKEKSNKGLIDYAIKNYWYASLPWDNEHGLKWSSDVKDAAQASRKYGRIFTLKSILESITDDQATLKLFKSRLMHLE